MPVKEVRCKIYISISFINKIFRKKLQKQYCGNYFQIHRYDYLSCFPTTCFKISVRHNTTVTSLRLWATNTNRVYSQLLHYILPLLKNFCEAKEYNTGSKRLFLLTYYFYYIYLKNNNPILWNSLGIQPESNERNMHEIMYQSNFH